MKIGFDPAKRARTIAVRDLDFLDAGQVFIGKTATLQDTRFHYDEDRFITAGYLHGRCVVIVWTPRGQSRHIISMRHTHAAEERNWFG